jgi:hypothetical protein
MNNTMMMGLFAVGGLAFLLLRGRLNTGNWGGSLLDSGHQTLPSSSQQRPDNPPANLTWPRRNIMQTGGAGTGYGIDEFGDEG